MEVSGHDVILTVPTELEAARITVSCALAEWPRSIVVDDADGSVQTCDHFTTADGHDREEYFIFQNASAYESWKSDGPTDENSADMLHFIARPIAEDAAHREVTLVHYSASSAIRGLVADVRTALTSHTASTAR
jgi:hypothetical protein